MIAAAVCPHPPGLVPEVAGSGAGVYDGVRSAAIEAVRTLCAADPELLVVLGDGPERASFQAGTAGSFADYGVDVPVVLPGAEPDTARTMPLSLLAGAWLLAQAGWSGRTRGETIAAETPASECVTIGADLVAAVDRVGLLVMGDGTVGRADDAPRPFDPRAEQFDRRVADAFRVADPAALLSLDAELAGQLNVAGRAAWQVLAGATGEVLVDANVLYDAAPTGVGYFVVVWERHG